MQILGKEDQYEGRKMGEPRIQEDEQRGRQEGGKGCRKEKRKDTKGLERLFDGGKTQRRTITKKWNKGNPRAGVEEGIKVRGRDKTGNTK